MIAKNHSLANLVVDATANTLVNLKARWNEEKKYEDFSEYASVMENLFEDIEGALFIEMTKRPFGFKWIGEDGAERHTFIKGKYIETNRLA